MHLRNSENFTQWLTYRLQKLAVIHYVFMFIVTPILSIYFTIKLALSTYWWFLIFYGIWVFYDFRTPERGSRPKEWMRKCVVWKYFADYFPMTLTKVEDLSTNHNYIIGSHPHGILSFGAFATFCTDGTGFSQLFPGLKSYLVTLNGQFWFPFRRDELMLTGAIASSADSLNHILSEENGRAVGVVLGGAEEVLDTNPGSYDLNLSKRRGFIKIALRNGAYLVPMYNFGENNTYSQVLPNYRGSKMRALQRIVKKYWGFCPPLINGCGIFSRSFGLLPRRTPINTVIGRPIVVEKNLNPSQEEIDALHSEYCTQLRKLFDEYKMNFGIDKSITLNIY